jgi:alpha-ketoglutarate-dependent taurine dioxygenase
MKISKIPGLGRFGVFIDDVDFTTLTDEEWQEIGRIHLESLVTIIRNTKLDPFTYYDWMKKWGTARELTQYDLEKKYGCFVSKLLVRAFQGDPSLDPEDAQLLKTKYNMVLLRDNGAPTSVLKVTGRRLADGSPEGMFAEGELLWHSNESGNLAFTPAVSLLGNQNMIGSSTGFVTTTDWYERQSESFRSELDEMVIVHKFTPGKINPGLRQEQDLVMYKNMCPVDGVEIPLIIQSPGGIRGLHYSVNTIDYIKGMTREESQKIFDIINQGIFVPEYTYDHWYQSDNDLCLFDNSITLHRRLGDITGRLAYRIQYDYETILSEPWQPYLQEPYQTQYRERIVDVMKTLERERYPLPL